MREKRHILFSVLFVFAASTILAYDQVQIGKIIPFAEKKFTPSKFKIDSKGQFWILNQKTKALHVVNKEGRTSLSLRSGKSKKSNFKNPSDFSFLRNGHMVVADPGLNQVVVLAPKKGKGLKGWKKPELVQRIPVPNPTAVATSLDDVIAVANGKEGIVQIYSLDGVLLHNIFSSGANAFKDIVGLEYANDGTLWVLDGDKNKLHRFSPSRKRLGTVENLASPQSLDVDEFGFAYVSLIRGKWVEVSPKGKVTGTFGAKGKKPGQLSKPVGLAVQNNDTVWVAEIGNRRLQSFSITNSNKKEKSIYDPVTRIQVRRLENLSFLADSVLFNEKGEMLLLNRKKRKFSWTNENGKVLGSFGRKGKGTLGFSKPMEMAMGPKGSVWVTDSGDHKIKEVSPEGEILKTVGEKGKKEGNIKAPSFIEVRKDGSFVVADKGNKRIQVLSKDGLFLFRVGKKKQIELVSGLAVNDEKIAVIDDERKALLFFDTNGKFISEIANKEDKAPVWSSLTDIKTDEKGRFYILDQSARRVRIFNPKGKFLADLFVSGVGLALGPDHRVLVRKEEAVSLFAVDFVARQLKPMKAEDEQGIVKVSWAGCDSCVDYKIYKSSSTTNFQLVSSTSGLEFFDEDVRAGAPYIYAVRGVNDMGYEGNWTPSKIVKPSRRKDISLVSIGQISFKPVFTAAFKYYVDQPVGTIEIQNNDDRPYRNVKLSLSLKKYTDYPTEKVIKKLYPGERKKIPMTMTFNNAVLELTENTPVQADVRVTYFESNQKKSVSKNAPLTLYSRNAIVWNDKARISSFITPRDVPVMEFSRSAIRSFLKPLKGSTVGKPLAKTALFYEALNALNISYVPDPKTPFAEVVGNAEIIDYVQYPRETLRRKTGDCDDTTALMSSLLESVGVETALVDTPGHIFLMANLDETDPSQIGLPEERFVEYKGSLWVPIETTKLGQDFFSAWQEGITQVRAAQESQKVEFIPIIEASERYQPVTLIEKEKNLVEFPEEKVRASFLVVLDKLQKDKYQAQLKEVKAQIKKDPDNNMLYIRLGMVHVEGKKISEAKKLFSSLLQDKDVEVQAGAHNNLGNLAYLNADYKTASKHYEDASILSPDDGGIVINRARTAWKLGQRKKTKALLIEAKDLLTDWRAYVSDIPAELLPKI